MNVWECVCETMALSLNKILIIENPKTLRRLEWIGKNITTPENRAILGVSALLSQPWIDLSNKKVDEDTRKYSAARTVAKIIAGTTTGVAIRYGCIKLIDSFTKLPSEIKATDKLAKFRKLFVPDFSKLSAEQIKALGDLKHYKNSIGSIIAAIVMVFTNFLIDAPLTKFLTNKFTDKIKKSEAGVKEGNNG